MGPRVRGDDRERWRLTPALHLRHFLRRWIDGAGFVSTAAGAAACGVVGAHRPVLPAPGRLCAGSGAASLPAASAFAGPATEMLSASAPMASAGDMRDGCRRPRRASDHADRRQRACRTIGPRQIVVEIVARPVRRHEADDAGAGIDHQPPSSPAAVNHGNV